MPTIEIHVKYGLFELKINDEQSTSIRAYNFIIRLLKTSDVDDENTPWQKNENGLSKKSFPQSRNHSYNPQVIFSISIYLDNLENIL